MTTVVSIGEIHIANSLSQTIRRPKYSAEQRSIRVLASWKDVKYILPAKVRNIGCDFVDLCQEHHAFHCDPECNIDIVDEDSVMFDWNNGALPIFTALITPSPSITFVGSFEYGKVKGEASNLDSVRVNLIHFVNEIGSEIWETSVLHDSWLKEEKASQVDERVCIRHQEAVISPFLQLGKWTTPTSSKQGSMLLTK